MKKIIKLIDEKIMEARKANDEALELIDKALREIKKTVEEKHPGIEFNAIFSKVFNLTEGRVILQAKGSGDMDKFDFHQENKNYETLEDFIKQWNLQNTATEIDKVQVLYKYYFKEAANGISQQIYTFQPPKYKYIEPKFKSSFECERYVWELKKSVENFLIPKASFVPDVCVEKVFKDYVESLLLFNDKKLLPVEEQVDRIYNELVEIGLLAEGLNSSQLMLAGKDEKAGLVFEKEVNDIGYDAYAAVWQKLMEAKEVAASEFIKNLNIPKAIVRLAKGDNTFFEKLSNNSLYLRGDEDFYSAATQLDLDWDYGNQVIAVIKNIKTPERKIESFDMEFFVQ